MTNIGRGLLNRLGIETCSLSSQYKTRRGGGGCATGRPAPGRKKSISKEYLKKKICEKSREIKEGTGVARDAILFGRILDEVVSRAIVEFLGRKGPVIPVVLGDETQGLVGGFVGVGEPLEAAGCGGPRRRRKAAEMFLLCCLERYILKRIEEENCSV